MLDEGVIPPLTCLRVLTLSWMGLGKPTRVSISLENNKHHYATLKEDNVSGIAYCLRWNTYFPRVKPMNLFLLVSRKCSMSFSLHIHRFWIHFLNTCCHNPACERATKQPFFHVSAHTHTNKHKSTAHCISFLKSHQSNCRCLCVKVSDPPADPYLICSFIVNAVKSEHSQHNTTKRCLFQSAVKSRYDN